MQVSISSKLARLMLRYQKCYSAFFADMGNGNIIFVTFIYYKYVCIDLFSR